MPQYTIVDADGKILGQAAVSAAYAQAHGTSDQRFITSRPPDALHTWDGSAWQPPSAAAQLATAIANQVRALNAARDAADVGGFTWSGHTFQSDPLSQRHIGMAVIGANAAKTSGDTSWSIIWTLADNSTVTLSADDMIAVGTALQQALTRHHAICAHLKEKARAATTLDEVKNYGWPPEAVDPPPQS